MRTGGRSGRRLRHQRFQPFERKRQVRAAFVVRHGVDFIHDHRLNVAQDGAAFFRRQQDVKRLRRGNKDVGRMRQHRPAFRRQRVAGAHGGADGRHRQASRSRQRGDFTERHFQILANVVAQCLERRNIKRLPCGPRARRSRALRIRRSMQARNAASVLPEPVGAQISVDLPARMDGQPCSCGSVGEPNLPANHSWTSGCAQAREASGLLRYVLQPQSRHLNSSLAGRRKKAIVRLSPRSLKRLSS